MPEASADPSTGEIEERISAVGRYSRYSRAGLVVILAAFALAAVVRLPSNLESVPAAVDAVLMPAIFVGMGLLLYGIGMHLHVMHLNLVDQLRRRKGESDGSDGGGEGS